MFLTPSFDPSAQAEVVAPGGVLRVRNQRPTSVLHIDSGRVLLGVRDGEQMRHQLGVVEGPAWLDAAPVLLEQPCAVDMVAETVVHMRSVPRDTFMRGFAVLPDSVQSLLRDMAAGYCQQTELAVSRLAKDAEARCAEWLLRHAEPAQDAPGTLAVMLRQRKRMIAAQLGIAPETLSRVLRHLRERSLISGSGRVLNLLDLNGLRALAGA